MNIRGHVINLRTLALCLVVVITGCSSVELAQIPTRIRADIIDELNRYRINQNLSAVGTNAKLDELAANRARHAWPYRYQDLKLGHAYFRYHIDIIRPQGLWFGENLYAGLFTPAARVSIQAWHDSDSHRRMMSRPTIDDCSAVEAYDGKQSVLALICADKTNSALLKGIE